MTCTKNMYDFMNLKDEQDMIQIAYDLKHIEDLEERLKFYIEFRPRAMEQIQASVEDIIQDLIKQIRKEKLKRLQSG